MEQQRVDHDGKVYGKVGPEDYEDGHMAEQDFLKLHLKVSKFAFRLRLALLSNVVLVLLLAGTWVAWHGDGWPFGSNMAFKRLNPYSPLLERLNMDLTDIVYNGTIWNEGNDILRSEWPSPESDVAWDRVTATKMFSISESEVRAMGRDPAEAVKLPSSWGRGGDLYGAYLDGQHMLHCLKEVRKMVYFQYYYAPHWGNDSNTMNMPYEWKAHTSHCIYLLLQSLRCQPSMAMNTLQYIDRVDNRPYIDGRTKRRCVNHEAILDWQEEQAWFTDDMLSKVTPGPDSIIFQKPPEPEEK